MTDAFSTSSQIPELYYIALFDALSCNSHLLQNDAPRYTILASTEPILQYSGLQREDVIGKGIFEILRGHPDEINHTAANHLMASFEYVLEQKKAHQLPMLRYDVADGDGRLAERYWKVENKPVLARTGEVAYIIHTTEDITQQVKAREREAEMAGIEKAFALFMHAPIVIGLVNGDDYLLELANNEAFKLFGKDAGIIGKPIMQALPELGGKGIIELFDGVRLSGQPYIGREVPVTTFLNGSKELHYFNTVCQPYYGNGSTATGVFTISHDVTEQVKAKQKAQESEEKYHSLFESMDQGYCTLEIILDGERCVDYRYLEINPAFERQSGLINAIGKTIREMAPDIEQKWFDFYGGVALTGKPIRIEEESPALNKWFEVYAVRIGRAEEKKVGVFFTDVSARKKAEEALVESEGRFRNMVEQAPVAITLTRGLDVVIESINAPMLRLMNKLPMDEVAGKKMLEVLPELKDQQALEIVLEVQKTGIPFRGDEQPVDLIVNGKMKRHYFNFSYTPIFERGTVAAVLHVALEVTEQVLAKRKVEESEAKLRTILNSAPTAMGVFVGPELIVENPNQLLIEVMGAGSDIEGKSFRQLLAGLVDEDQMFLDLVDGVRTTGEVFDAQEVEVFFKIEKKTRYFNISFIPLRDENDAIYAVLDVSVDVTEQVLARRKIEESEGRFRLLADASPNLIWMLKPDGSYGYVNKTALDFLDVTQEQIAALGWAPFLHPGDLETATQAITEAVKEKHRYELEHRLRHKDGEYRWVLSQAIPAYDAGGNVFAYVGSSIDIHETKKSRQELQTALEQARLSKEAAELGTFDLDVEKGSMHWDDRCRILFGISHHEPVTFERDFMGGLHANDRERVIEVVRRAYIKSLSNGDYDVEYRTIGAEDGIVRWVRAKGKVYFDADEKPVRFIGSVLDITEQVMSIQKIESLVEERTKQLAQANESLLQANQELQRSNSNLEEFTYAASHDLKEPIRKITVFTHRLKDQLANRLSENDDKIFGRIQNATERMGNLIDDLLVYSHVTQRPHETESIDLNQKLQRVLEDLELYIQEKNAVVQVGTLPVVNGYRRQLQQLFQNLISNALKYSKADVTPRVDISATELIENGKRYHVISVKDNGIGFEEQYADKIFHMFTRLHSKAEYSGTGVGLSIVKKVVENHDGSIRVESTPGVGSTFIVSLPDHR